MVSSGVNVMHSMVLVVVNLSVVQVCSMICDCPPACSLNQKLRIYSCSLFFSWHFMPWLKMIQSYLSWPFWFMASLWGDCGLYWYSYHSPFCCFTQYIYIWCNYPICLKAPFTDTCTVFEYYIWVVLYLYYDLFFR